MIQKISRAVQNIMYQGPLVFIEMSENFRQCAGLVIKNNLGNFVITSLFHFSLLILFYALHRKALVYKLLSGNLSVYDLIYFFIFPKIQITKKIVCCSIPRTITAMNRYLVWTDGIMELLRSHLFSLKYKLNKFKWNK